MKKILVLTIKFGIGLFPITMRKRLKNNLRLTAFYSRVLRNAGVIQNLPSAQQQSEAYIKNMLDQSTKFTQMSPVSSVAPVLIVIVVEADRKKLAVTLKSIEQLANQADVLFYCLSEYQGKCKKILKNLRVDDFDGKTITSLTDQGALGRSEGGYFIIFEGDSLHADYAKVITTVLLPSSDIAYVDSDTLSEEGVRHTPEFYPDWNPDLQISTGYIRSGVWVRDIEFLLANVPAKISANYVCEWMIVFYLNNPSGSVQHISYTLLHGSDAALKGFNHSNTTIPADLAEKAEVFVNHSHDVLSLKWKLVEEPLVSLIIPTKNGKDLVKACIESIFAKSTYSNFEILLVDNNSDDPEALAYFDSLRLHAKVNLLKYPFEFNYSAINNFAVKHARGEIIGLVNNDIEVVEPDWLTHMVGHAVRPDIGCVGAKLIYANGLIQHAGVVMGYGGGAGHAHKYFPAAHPGYLKRIVATQNFSAVTAACLLVKKSDYEQVGGLNEIEFKVAFNDVDFCLRILGLGRRNLYCAEAVLYHHESVSRGFEDTVEKQARFNSEVAYMQTTWQHFITHDPAYNSNLTLRYENFAIKE